MIHTLTSAEHRNPEVPGSFLERPVRGIPDSKPRAPFVVSGARSTFIARAALTCFRGVPSKAPTHVPIRPITSASRLSTLLADSFGLVTPRSPAPCGVVDSFVSEVRALASTHPRGAEILPTDVCHPILLFSLSLCTRALVARRSTRLAPDSSERPAGSRRRACWGGTARFSASCSLADVVAIFAC